MENKIKHKATIKVLTYKESYHVQNSGWTYWKYKQTPRLEKDYIVKEDLITIGKYALESPVLKEGDDLYLHDLDETGRVERVVRSTDNSYVYVLGVILDKNVEKASEEDLRSAEIELGRVTKKYNDWLNEKEKETKSDKLDKKWYQFWK